jgi:hypothetical protein
MIVQALWFGGSSYSDRGEVEQFRSITHAIETFRERAETSGAYPLSTYYVNRENEPVTFPAVGRDCTMDVYTHPANTYPSFTLELGPRGGVRRRSFTN